MIAPEDRSMREAVSKVALVTGASRGAGRGIAIALGQHGYTVYVTGRTLSQGADAPFGGIRDCAEAVSAAGGRGVAVAVDHADDAQVRALIERVERDCGRLDVLVNNVAHIAPELAAPGHFYDKPLHLADIITVGLRSQYVASYYAAPLMVRQRCGLIVNTSSPGSVCYMHGPAYGAQKAGVDKMVADMAVDLRESNVAAVSIWMGILLTEQLLAAAAAQPVDSPIQQMVAGGETPRFTGHLIAALCADPELMTLSGRTVIGAELAERYGLKDEDGRQPPSHRAWLGAPREPSDVVLR
jgi:NAD(P)-dependent dehydrogenase (short-subunit alcohol dehydrogenase family)